MISFLKGLFKFHLIPIVLAIILLYTADFFLADLLSPSIEKTIITGDSDSKSTNFINCIDPKAEIELMASFENKNFITLFGSSELQGLPYSPYFFLPDTLGLNIVAFGHAHQQNLSIACQLLAAGDKLDGAKVCIILSPGWFQTEGTNIEAFLEFVRPNFLRSIIYNESIPKKDKLHIAQFITGHFDDIESPSIELLYFKNLIESEKLKGFALNLQKTKCGIKNIDYSINYPLKSNSIKRNQYNWKSAKDRLEKEFLSTSTNNSIFVEDGYFKKYLATGEKFEKPKTAPIKIGREFEDFQLVLEILKRKNCKASFILQPLNPHYYDNLNEFKPTITKIQSELKKAQFPFLNLFVYSTEEFTPGVLNDIMHPSNRGWMDMNEFILKQYYE